MKKAWSSKLLIAGLALVLVLAAGCDRPDANATLSTPTIGRRPWPVHRRSDLMICRQGSN